MAASSGAWSRPHRGSDQHRERALLFEDALAELPQLLVADALSAPVRHRVAQRLLAPLHESREAYGADALSEGNHAFERIGYLLGDLLESPSLAVHLHDDGAGSLRALLDIFERHGVSLSSIHSSRTPAGDVHFRFGFGADQDWAALDAVARDIETSGIGRLIV